MMKSKFTKPQTNILFALVFAVVIATSPWFWVLVRNHTEIKIDRLAILLPSNPAIVDQVNSLRGELLFESISPFLARLLVNKASIYFIEVFGRYLESFDLQFLFFIGDVDTTMSTHAVGPMLLTLLPAIIVGIGYHLQKRNKFLFFLLLFSPIFPAVLTTHYETLSRIPFFVVLLYIAAVGFVRIFKTKKVLLVVFILLYLFDFARFTHDFYIHYPRRMAESTYTR